VAETLKTAVAVVGIDIGKMMSAARSRCVRWSPGQLESRFANVPPCLIGMEACVGGARIM